MLSELDAINQDHLMLSLMDAINGHINGRH